MTAIILAKVWPYLLGALALLAGWFTAKRHGKVEAERDALAKSIKAEAKEREIAREATQKVDAMDIDDLRDRAIRRMRNRDK